jgi:hypothetical protein
MPVSAISGAPMGSRFFQKPSPDPRRDVSCVAIAIPSESRPNLEGIHSDVRNVAHRSS